MMVIASRAGCEGGGLDSGGPGPVFAAAADELFRDAPLYRALCRGAAADPEVLAIAAQAGPGQSPVLMLLAAVRFLLQRGAAGPLADLYTARAAGWLPDEDPSPLLRQFCRLHAAELRHLVASRRVQTNEVGRSAYLRLALSWWSLRSAARPIGLVEIGASAGLNLIWDSYLYRFRCPEGADLAVGAVGSPVAIDCRLSGAGARAVAAAPPPLVAERLGLDLDPVDLRSADAVDWLAAFVWADHAERSLRLGAAIELARQAAVSVERGDAIRDLAARGAALRDDLLLVVFHSFVTTQMTAAGIAALDLELARLAADREVVEVGLEQPRGPARLALVHWAAGRAVAREILAEGDPHGSRICWLGGR